MVEVGPCLPDAGDRIEGHVVGEDRLLVGFQGRHEARVGGLVVRGQVYEEGDVYHVIVEGGRGMEVLHIFPVVREVNHGLQVQVCLGVFEDVLHHPVVVGDGEVVIVVRVFLGNAQLIPEVHRYPGDVGVMAAVDIDENDTLLCRRQLFQYLQGIAVVVLFPVGIIAAFGDHGDAGTGHGAPVMEGNPVRPVPCRLCHVHHAYHVFQGHVAVLVGAGHGVGQGEKGIREIGVCMVSQGKVRGLRHFRKPGGRIFRIIRSEGLHVVPVGTFPDDHDVGALIDTISGIRRREGHILHVFVQIIIQLLENLEFTAVGTQRFEKSSREDVGDLPVASAEEEAGNHRKSHGKGPAGTPEEGTVEGAGCLHHGPGEAYRTGNDDAQGDDRHHKVHGRPHGTEEILDFLHVGGTDCHHGEHIHFPAEEHVVADVDEGDEHHEEGVNPGNHGPQGPKMLCPCGEGGVYIGKRKEHRPQHVVVTEMLLLRQRCKSIGPGKGPRPQDGKDHRPGKEPFQIGSIHGEEKPEGHDQHHQQRRPQPGLYITVDIRKIAAQVEKRHDHHSNPQGPEQRFKYTIFHNCLILFKICKIKINTLQIISQMTEGQIERKRYMA